MHAVSLLAWLQTLCIFSEKKHPKSGIIQTKGCNAYYYVTTFGLLLCVIVILKTTRRAVEFTKPKTNKSASKQVQSYACVDSAEREQIQQTNVC